MAGSLKTLGLRESAALRRRVNRQHSLERITKTVRDKLVRLLDEFDATVVEMQEEGGDDDGS